MKRGADGDIVAFERGDVVWGIDPFKQDAPRREASKSAGFGRDEYDYLRMVAEEQYPRTQSTLSRVGADKRHP